MEISERIQQCPIEPEEFVASMLSKYHAYRWLEMNGYERCLIEGDI